MATVIIVPGIHTRNSSTLAAPAIPVRAPVGTCHTAKPALKGS